MGRWSGEKKSLFLSWWRLLVKAEDGFFRKEIQTAAKFNYVHDCMLEIFSHTQNASSEISVPPIFCLAEIRKLLPVYNICTCSTKCGDEI